MPTIRKERLTTRNRDGSVSNAESVISGWWSQGRNREGRLLRASLDPAV